MAIDDLMEYATNLADLEFDHFFEDLFKLGSLVEEIAEAKLAGAQASEAIESEFHQSIKIFFKARGSFRMEIERRPLAKQYLKNL